MNSLFYDSPNFGTMPPAVLVDEYYIKSQPLVASEIQKYKIGNIVAKPIEIYIKYNFELVKKLLTGWEDGVNGKSFEYPYDGYVNHSHRCAIVHNGAVANEYQVKQYRWRQYIDAVDRVNIISKDIPALELFNDYVNDLTCTYGEHTKVYVKEHESAHPIKGTSWGELLKQGLMMTLKKFTSATIKIWKDRFYDEGDWAVHPAFIGKGVRARTPQGTDLAINQWLVLKRMRNVGFYPGPSSIGAFDPHEKQILRMRKIFDYFQERWGTRIISPKTEGGQAYLDLQQYILDGKYEVINQDVAGMELITPSLISGSTKSRPFGVGICTYKNGIIPELISGVFPTSDLDMLAHLKLLDALIKEPPKLIVILGDDETIVGGKLRSSILMERVGTDERIHRTLGLSIGRRIHPVGTHITVDTANRRINVPNDGEWHRVAQKLNIRERLIIVDLFHGHIQGKPFDEVLAKTPSMEGYYSPKEWLLAKMEQLAAKAAPKSEDQQ
jgi:hypothetical protein